MFVYFHPCLWKIPILTNIFQMGWNHQPNMGPLNRKMRVTAVSSQRQVEKMWRDEEIDSLLGDYLGY